MCICQQMKGSHEGRQTSPSCDVCGLSCSFSCKLYRSVMCQLCSGGNILVDACVGEPSAFDVVQDLTTVVFHQKCPINPNWAHSSDGQGNM
jgi:hypothetical protein